MVVPTSCTVWHSINRQEVKLFALHFTGSSLSVVLSFHVSYYVCGVTSISDIM